MKKFISLVLAFILLCSVSAISFAEDMGVQVIGRPAAESGTGTVDISDFKPGDVAKIDGLGEITFEGAFTKDYFYSGAYRLMTESGKDAEFLIISLNILNTQKKAVDYLKKISDVVCDFGDGYQFAGWKRQASDSVCGYLEGYYIYKQDESTEINTLYTGRYWIGVTVPNYVINSTEPLSISFTIDGNEFTYYWNR